jgi:hypothetical protein
MNSSAYNFFYSSDVRFILAHEGLGTLQRLQEDGKSIKVHNIEISCLIEIMMQCKSLIANEFPKATRGLKFEGRIREAVL